MLVIGVQSLLDYPSSSVVDDDALMSSTDSHITSQVRLTDTLRENETDIETARIGKRVINYTHALTVVSLIGGQMGQDHNDTMCCFHIGQEVA